MNIILDAPSKINLYLRVKGKRSDGYHEIETLFYPLDNPADKISVSENLGLSVSCSGPDIPAGRENICWKAARKYADAAGIKADWHISIEKNIPVAAGMGGGSSDAAAVLKALQKKFNALTPELLHEIATGTGADVPFFLNPVPSIAEGIGDKLSPLDFKTGKIPVLIAAPLFPVSAAWSYKNAVIPDSPPSLSALLEALKKSDWETCGKLLHNDLARAVYNKFPLTRAIKEKMLELGACGAEITGSGPTLFGIFKSPEAVSGAVPFMREAFGPSVRFIC